MSEELDDAQRRAITDVLAVIDLQQKVLKDMLVKWGVSVQQPCTHDVELVYRCKHCGVWSDGVKLRAEWLS